MPPADSSQEKNKDISQAHAEEVGYHVVDVEPSVGQQPLHTLRQYAYTHGCNPHLPISPLGTEQV